MLELTLVPLKDELTALPWVERYGGIARPLRIYTEGTETYKLYPIRKGLTHDQCHRQARYTDLIPDSRYANLLYSEIQQHPTERPSTVKGRNMVMMESKVRLVYWLNLAKMGKTQDGSEVTAGRIGKELISTLIGMAKLTDGSTVEYLGFTNIVSDPAIFSPYDYPQSIGALMLYPYDFGAVDFTVRHHFTGGCDTPMALETPIECVTDWG